MKNLLTEDIRFVTPSDWENTMQYVRSEVGPKTLEFDSLVNIWYVLVKPVIINLNDSNNDDDGVLGNL